VEWNETHFVPNLTVIIPWDGNHFEWLEESINSIHPDIPVVVRRGIGTAGNGLNKAIDRVETDYFFVLAADDILHPDCLRHLAESIGTADFAYPTLRRFGDSSGDFTANLFSLHQLQYRNYIPGCFMGKTSIAKEMKWSEEIPYEDWDFHYRAAMKGFKYVPVPHAIYFYRIHGASTIQRTATAIRDAELTFEDIRRAVAGEPYKTLATFLLDLSAGSSYVRGVIPAKYLPAVATQRVSDWATIDDVNRDCPNEVAIFQYPAKSQIELVRKCREAGKSIFVEVDDDYTSPNLQGYLRSCSNYYPPFRTVADLWKNQSQLHANIARSADGVIVSTPELAERYGRLNKLVYLALNTVDPNDWPEPITFEDEVVRVGYSCGVQH
jgi:hypothetical protein